MCPYLKSLNGIKFLSAFIDVYYVSDVTKTLNFQQKHKTGKSGILQNVLLAITKPGGDYDICN
jgi:hypothetical protein